MDKHQVTTAALSAPAATREIVVCAEDRVVRVALSGSVVTIGRGESSDVCIAHASVSRAHARLLVGEHGITVEDLQSSNGTKVDGVPVTGVTTLRPGSLLQVGAVRCVLGPRGGPPPGPRPMAEVRTLMERFAASALSLVLIGETGTGKEVLTEEIHARSGRKGPLVRINCAGLSASLIESELFGHERGAFTGATHAKAGLIESAEGGTFFFDELGEMPEATQPKLLRVLESREVRRIGALRGRAIDVRFVSATHRDLQALAAMGRFREDLLFRLNGFTLRLPPLRERRDELLPLAERFLAEASARAGRPTPRLSEAATALLLGHRFPGNVRELRTVVERAALVADGPVVTVDHLLFDTTPPPSEMTPGPVSRPPPSGSGEDAERKRLVRALSDAGGNQGAAAEALGMTRRMLGYRMDKLGLPRPRRR